MGNFIACIGAGLGWCCCSASASLISSCCGNDKPSTIAPGLHSGRKRSVLLLLISIGLSFLYQYWVGPALKPMYANDLNPVLAYLSEAWLEGCEQYTLDHNENSTLIFTNDDLDRLEVQREKCSGNHGVYRVAGSAFLFYILAAIAAFCKPTANRQAWPAKFVLFFLLVAGTLFIPNEPLFSPILMNIFRVGGFIFVVFNQLIILDIAFNVNEHFVEKADKAELDEGPGTGKKWLGAILFSCAFLILASLVSIGVMYHYFGSCSDNNAFITITLVLGIGLTAVQLLSGEEASLFTSSCIFAYSTYLLYTAVGRNPREKCNPQLGQDNNIGGIVLGLVVTLLGMAWTGYSYTAHRAVGERSDESAMLQHNHDNNERQHQHQHDQGQQDPKKTTGRNRVTGLVVVNHDHRRQRKNNNNNADDDEEEDYATTNNGPNQDGHENTPIPQSFSNSWKINMILSLICCWYAMSLTSWGSVTGGGGNIANPSAGRGSMWMIISSQWLMNFFYLWTLIAPKLFPDREFS
mmetsp:Transcript_1098/g.1967  ORF Transcript_1098/g.1967 Transcript_1098/m.1967 type:complete len:521 (-) Transcript_1098:138-1700(-)